MGKRVDTDNELFLSAVADVTPLPADQRGHVPTRPARRRNEPRFVSRRNIWTPTLRPEAPAEALQAVHRTTDDLLVREELLDLVDGDAPFDVSDTPEYVEGSAPGIDRKLVKRLRRGELAIQNHLDLHGRTVAEAHEALEHFVWSSRRSQHRCVLVIHGRGLHSKTTGAVLKEGVVQWLSRGRLARCVLAFTSAQPHDGGAGAVYVLLRR